MRFAKMHGLGNDFIIIDSITQNVHLNHKDIIYLSNRHYGIGCDQLLIIEPPYDPEVDFHCRIYNSDGTEVNQCGNGIRCVARFVYIKKLTNKLKIRISTATNQMIISIMDDTQISTNMGEPIFEPKLIPFYKSQYQNTYILFLPNQVILCGIVSIGNPHCIILVDNINIIEVTKLGSKLENHHCFPNRANISFMQIINRKNISLKVYERSAGETKACGSAACAAAAIGIQQKLLNNIVQVKLPGGTLTIHWEGPGHPLYMNGTTNYVYEGSINL